MCLSLTSLLENVWKCITYFELVTSTCTNMVVALVADHLVFHRTQVPFQQREIQVTRIFRTMSSKVVGFTRMLLSCWVFTSQTVQYVQLKHHSRLHKKMWHWGKWDPGRKGTSVLGDRRQYDSSLCLQSTSCSCQDSGPVQSAFLDRREWCYRWSQTEYRKLQNSALLGAGCWDLRDTNPWHCLELHQHWNRLPLLLIHGGLPWHPNRYQERTLHHTVVHRWLSGLFLRIAPIALFVWKAHQSKDNCPEFWVCVAVSGVRTLHHLRSPWQMPPKDAWAHDGWTCCARCGTDELKAPRLSGSHLNQTCIQKNTCFSHKFQ